MLCLDHRICKDDCRSPMVGIWLMNFHQEGKNGCDYCADCAKLECAMCKSKLFVSVRHAGPIWGVRHDINKSLCRLSSTTGHLRQVQARGVSRAMLSVPELQHGAEPAGHQSDAPVAALPRQVSDLCGECASARRAPNFAARMSERNCRYSHFQSSGAIVRCRVPRTCSATNCPSATAAINTTSKTVYIERKWFQIFQYFPVLLFFQMN